MQSYIMINAPFLLQQPPIPAHTPLKGLLPFVIALQVLYNIVKTAIKLWLNCLL